MGLQCSRDAEGAAGQQPLHHHPQIPDKTKAKDRPVAECGVHIGWLCSWAESVLQRLGPDATTAEVCAKIVIPDTRAQKCRYVDLLDEGHVGSPEFFISHTWSWGFGRLISTVKRRLRSSPDAFVWLDICAINQNAYEHKGELQADDISCLATVVGKVQSTLFCLDESGAALTRVWCLFEIWQTCSHNPKGATALQMLTYEMPQLGKLFRDLDVSKAQASLESDRVRILAEINADVGHAALSRSIKQALVTSADHEAQQALALVQHRGEPNTSSTTTTHGEGDAESAEITAGEACNKAAQVAIAAGEFDLAQRHAAGSVELRTRALGVERPETLQSLNNLGRALKSLGKWAQALEIFEGLVEVQKRVLGEEHPDYLSTVDNVAVVLSSMGRVDEAIALAQPVVDLRRQLLAPDHSDLLMSIDNLATMHHSQARYAQAAQLQQEVVEVRQRVLGMGHPSTLSSLANYAVTLRSLNRLAEAAEFFSAVAEQSRAVLGEEHPDTLQCLSNLASTFWSLGELEKTAATHREVLEVRRRKLGDSHPDTLVSVANTAVALDKLPGCEEEVLALKTEVLEARRRVLGSEHPSTLSSMASLALTLGKSTENSEKLVQAASLLEDVLRARQRLLGVDHNYTQVSMTNLNAVLLSMADAAVACADGGDVGACAELEQRVLEVRMRVQGEEHLDTALAKHNLAISRREQGRLQEAESLLQQAVAVRAKLLGDTHQTTLHSLNRLEGVRQLM